MAAPNGRSVAGKTASVELCPCPFSQQQPEALLSDLRCAKFKIKGIEGEKHAVFIPDHLQLSADTFEKVCRRLGKNFPSLLLCGVSSLRHPARMSTAELRGSDTFKPLVESALASLGLKGDYADLPSTKQAKVNEVIDSVFEQKLASTVANVATAAARVNAWIFSGPQITNFEILLQQVVRQSEADVFRVAVAHMQDQAYMECPESKRLMQQLYNVSEEIGPVEVTLPKLIDGSLWDPSVSGHKEFSTHGFDLWTFDSAEQSGAAGHPVLQWPWPHADLFLLFVHEGEECGETGSTEVDWSFVTSKKFDVEAFNFKSTEVAPVGYIAIGEHSTEAQMKNRLISWVKHAHPLVILDHTPHAARQMGLLVNIIKKAWGHAPLVTCRPFLDGSMKLNSNPRPTDILQAMSPALILKEIERDYSNTAFKHEDKLSIPDVIALIEVAKQQGHTFKETVAVVDPIHDLAEQTLETLSSVFTSHSLSSDSSRTSTLHHAVVLKGWGIHWLLAHSALRRSRIINAQKALLCVLMFAALLLTFLLVEGRLEGEPVPGETAWQCVMLFLPVSIGFVMAWQGNPLFGATWASMHMSCNQVVWEIYHFLGSVGPYNLGPLHNQKLFMVRAQAAVNSLRLAGIPEQELPVVDNALREDAFEEAGSLDRHIKRFLYGDLSPYWPQLQAALSYWFWSMLWRLLPGRVGRWTRLFAQDPQDWTAPVSAELYMELRVAPLRRYFQAWAQALARRRRLLRVTTMFFWVLSIAMGVNGHLVWAPVSLTLASMVAAWEEMAAPKELAVAVNDALSKLDRLDMRWHCADMRERRLASTREHLIVTTEKLVLTVASVHSHAVMLCHERDTEWERAAASVGIDEKDVKANRDCI